MTDDELAVRIREESNRELPLAEAEAYLAAPLTDEERTATLELVTWFTRRYPQPLERLRYVSRAYRRWQRRPNTTSPT